MVEVVVVVLVAVAAVALAYEVSDAVDAVPARSRALATCVCCVVVCCAALHVCFAYYPTNSPGAFVRQVDARAFRVERPWMGGKIGRVGSKIGHQFSHCVDER